MPKPDKPAGEMRVLAFTASPRKGGNSDTLVDEALRGASDAGAGVEKIYLTDVNIKPCFNTLIKRDYFAAKKQLSEMSISYCVHARGFEDELHKGECTLEDDMPAIYTKIVLADAIIIGFPIYNGWETAVLTAFLERWNRYKNCIQATENSLKRGMLVSTWGYLDTDINDHIMENLITRLNFSNVQVAEVVVVCGISGMLSGLDSAGRAIIRRFPDELTKAYMAGQTLVTGER
jgi:FMN-dependent NADH-azoreductase